MSIAIDELPEGGMGIKIMSRLADELSYTRTPTHRNCLLLVKNYEQQAIEPSLAFQKDSILDKLIDSFNCFKYRPNQQQNCEHPLQKIYLQVNTDLNELDQVLQWFNQLEHLSISKTVLSHCRLALVEGFTNAARHAHRDLPWETPIALEITTFNQRLEMRIWDYGQPFDLEAKVSEVMKINQKLCKREGENSFRICAMAS